MTLTLFIFTFMIKKNHPNYYGKKKLISDISGYFQRKNTIASGVKVLGSLMWLLLFCCQVMSHMTPWTVAHDASLSSTIFQSLLDFMSTELAMLSNSLLLLLSPVFPSIRVFLRELAVSIKWPKYWSFSLSINPSNEYSGLISFRID